MKKFGYIYKITNVINKKIYIGKTKSSIQTRFKQHLYSVTHHKSKSMLYDAMNKYGADNFIIEEIDFAYTLQELNDKEIYWISYYDSRNPTKGYNICKGGECGPGGPMFKGHHHSEHTKQLMSATHSGKNNANYGNHWHQSDELRKLHSQLSSGENNGMFGKSHSNYTKRLIGLRNSNRIAYSNLQLDKVKMIHIEEIAEYEKNGWIKGNIHCHK